MKALIWAVPAFLLALAGCKSDGDGDGGGGIRIGESCESLTACGGDIEGSWTVQDICVEDAVALAGMAVDEPECNDLFASVTTDATGSFMFSGGSLTSTVVMTIDMHAVWTPACLMALSGVSNIDVAATCANLDAEYQSNPRFSAASCAVANGTCDCEISAEQQLFAGNSYMVQGTSIVFPSDGAVPYCVQGSTLVMGNDVDGRTTTITLSR